jgi:hypothetical protein
MGWMAGTQSCQRLLKFLPQNRIQSLTRRGPRSNDEFLSRDYSQ